MFLMTKLQVDNSSTGHSTDWSEVKQHDGDDEDHDHDHYDSDDDDDDDCDDDDDDDRNVCRWRCLCHGPHPQCLPSAPLGSLLYENS